MGNDTKLRYQVMVVQLNVFNTDTKATKCPYYGVVHIIEVEFVWTLFSFRPSELYITDRDVHIIQVSIWRGLTECRFDLKQKTPKTVPL